MPVFYTEQLFPVAEDLSNRGINLPSFPDLTDLEIKLICDIINNTLDECNKSDIL